MTTGIQDLPAQDLDLGGYDPQTHEDAKGGNYTLPPAGTYSPVFLEKFEFRTRKDGTRFNPPMLAVDLTLDVNGVRRTQRFIDIRYQAFKNRKANTFADFTRAFDKTRSWQTEAELVEVLTDAIRAKTPAKLRLDWEAFDTAYKNAQLADLDLRRTLLSEDDYRAAKNLIYNTATIRGMRKFPLQGDQTYAEEIVGPSGETLKARVIIDRCFPSA